MKYSHGTFMKSRVESSKEIDVYKCSEVENW